jgi:hypothetical protein
VTSLASISAPDDAVGPQKRSLAELAQAAERVEDYAGRSKSRATIKAYASGWRDFLAFCETRGLSPLPASDETVALYLSDMADRGAKAATMVLRHCRGVRRQQPRYGPVRPQCSGPTRTGPAD